MKPADRKEMVDRRWSSRLQDYAPDDWLNNYGIRRHSIWLNA